MPDHTAPPVQPVYQRLRAWRAGQLLFDTRRAHLYFPDDRHPLWAVPADGRPVLLIETGVAPRWYIPPGDVAWARLDPVPARTTCQYKGEASYFRVRDSDAELWTYRHPDPEAAAIAGHLAAAGQPGVQIIVDGTPEGQP
jgi:uncharacterized protein (DUF427 family)